MGILYMSNPMNDASAARNKLVASNPLGLRFNSQKDAFNFADKCVENARNWLASNHLNVAKRYSEGDVDLVAHFRPEPNSQKFNLIFRRVPAMITDMRRPDDLASVHKEVGRYTCRTDRDKYAMSFGVPYFVEGPEKVIPSLVWAEPFYDLPDCRADFPKRPEFTFKVSRCVGERELCGFGIAATDGDTTRVDAVIKAIPEVADSVLCDGGQLPWEFGSKPDLVNLLSGVSVIVDHCGIWLRLEECGAFRLEVFDVIPCAVENFSRAIE